MGLRNRSFILDARTVKLLCLGLLGLIIIFVCMMFVKATALENEVHTRVIGHLSKGGFDRVEVRINGRDIALAGAVSSVAAEERISNITKEISGVRVVHTQLDIAPLRLSHVRMRRDQTGWQEVSGALPSVEGVQELREYLGLDQAPEGDEIFAVIHDAEVSESPWISIVDEVLDASTEVQNLLLEIGAWRLVVGGSVDSATKYAGAIALLEDLAQQNELTLVNRLATIDRLR